MPDSYFVSKEECGTVNISEEVFTTIVRNAISEIEGVAGFAYTAGGDLADILGIKTLTKGLKIKFRENAVIIDAIINVLYGFNIYKVAKDVQENVVRSVQSTTGIECCEVNIHVSGISFEKKTTGE